MKALLIIETRDAADHADAARTADLAREILRTGRPAMILLTDNGAFNARRAHPYATGRAVTDGLQICVDTFALAERGIGEDELQDGISVVTLDTIVDRLIEGHCVVWR